MSMDVFRQFSSRAFPAWRDVTDLFPVVGTYVYCLWPFSGIVRSPLSYSPLDQSNLVGTYVHFLWPFFGIVPSPFINIQRYATPLLIFIQNPDDNIDLGRPIGACRRDRVMSMDDFRQRSSRIDAK